MSWHIRTVDESARHPSIGLKEILPAYWPNNNMERINIMPLKTNCEIISRRISPFKIRF